MDETPHASDFDPYAALWLAAAFAVGIFTASLIAIDVRVSAAAALAFGLAALLIRDRPAASVFILAAFAAAGSASFQTQVSSIGNDRVRSLYDSGVIRSGDPVEIEGVMLGGPEPSHDGVFLILRCETIKHRRQAITASGNVRLFLPTRGGTVQDAEDTTPRPLDTELKYGSRIRVATSLKREDELLNPGVLQRREYLDIAGIDATGSIKSALLIEKIADESVFIPLAWVYDRRAELIYDLRNNLDGRAAGVMIASLLGDKYFLDKSTGELFREGGTFHILVISGLHITFIGGLLLLAVGRFTRNRWTRFIVSAVALWAYTLAVGADLPVVRAAVMFTIISFAYVIYRQASLLNALGVCALLLLAWRPSELFNPSFQLTFVSVSAIVAMAFPLIEMLRKIGGWMPSAETPFPPNVPSWPRRFCETLYWNEDAWKIDQHRQVWSMRLFKAPLLQKYVVGGVRTVTRYLFEGILVSLIVQIWMLPLLVVYFHRVSVASVFLNLWVGFFVALESFAVVIGAALNQISGIVAMPFFDIANILNDLMLLLPQLVVDWGWASFRLPAYSGDGRVVYGVYFIPVVILALIANRWRPFDLKSSSFALKPAVLYPVLLSLVATGAIIIFHPFSASRADGRLHIDFLDVGQGDAALVTFPDGRTLLVDGGGRFRYRSGDEDNAVPFEPDVRGIGEAVMSEFLWHKGYSHINFILGSHADVDHIQGLSDVVRNFKVDSAIFARAPIADPDFAELAAALYRNGVPSTLFAGGMRIDFGDVTAEVLYPPASDDPEAVYDNEHSMVLRLTYGERSFLFTGDIERGAETALVVSGAPVTADLIKVAHHGSRTSSIAEFVDAVRPRYAIVPVGRSSPFGHPHPEVIERWAASGAKIMTTGEKGTISVTTDGEAIQIRTFLP